MSQARFQTLMLVLATITWLVLWYSTLDWPGYGLWIVLVSYFIADAGSYVLHYLIDFYGDGSHPGIVQEFQQHHARPGGIAESPLSEVMFPAAWIVVPLLLLLMLITVSGWLVVEVYLAVSVMGLCWGYAQLFHRWSHQPSVNALVRALQSLHLILPSNAHARHHQHPYASDYGVVNGWSNKLLDTLRLPVLLDWIMLRLGQTKRQLA